MACDADDERAEKERGDDDADEAEENGAEELQVGGERGEVVADFNASQETDENPGGEGAAFGGDGGD